MKTYFQPEIKKHFPILCADIAALIFLIASNEFLLFELLLISQLLLTVLLMAVHRQASRQLSSGKTWSTKTLIIQAVLLLGFCSFLFLLDLPWSLSHDWQKPASLLVGKASEVTTMLGVVIGAITVVGCLLLRKRGS